MIKVEENEFSRIEQSDDQQVNSTQESRNEYQRSEVKIISDAKRNENCYSCQKVLVFVFLVIGVFFLLMFLGNLEKSQNLSESEEHFPLRKLTEENILKLNLSEQNNSSVQKLSKEKPQDKIVSEKTEEQKDEPTFYVEDLMNAEIKSVLSNLHYKEKYKILNQAESYLIEERQKLNFTQTTEQIQALIKSMRKEDKKIKVEKIKQAAYEEMYLNEELTRDEFFAHQLNRNPEKQEYLEAEFYRYDQKYNISQYGEELPLCAIMIGKNNKNVIKNMYNSIKSQNYTNFKVIHIDDNSNDGTIEYVETLLKSSPILSKRVTLVRQPLQMGSLYNRDFSYSFCEENDVILDMDADDWLIGKQVFQLVNTIYQQGGNSYNITEEGDTWAVYFNLVKKTRSNPNYHSRGNIPKVIIEKQSYRIGGYHWRTTHLRTFLHKLYNKIDKNDFIDPMSQQFFIGRQDAFIQIALFELSAPRHIKFVDEFVYFYEIYSSGKKDVDLLYYSENNVYILPPYNQLESLDDEVTRNKNVAVPEKIQQNLKKYTAIVQKKYDSTKKKINELVDKAIIAEKKIAEKEHN